MTSLGREIQAYRVDQYYSDVLRDGLIDVISDFPGLHHTLKPEIASGIELVYSSLSILSNQVKPSDVNIMAADCLYSVYTGHEVIRNSVCHWWLQISLPIVCIDEMGFSSTGAVRLPERYVLPPPPPPSTHPYTDPAMCPLSEWRLSQPVSCICP